MIEKLPIVIKTTDELAIMIPKINAVLNRLEAQFNFQSMLANWYGEENSLVLINLELQTPLTFIELLTEHKGKKGFISFSDDVFSLIEESSKQVFCIIAITESELTLLSTQERLLSPYLQKKLHKVLNLIAEQLTLAALTPLSSS